MDWKNHPLVAASIACASTAVFCISFVVPIYEKKNLNSIADLEKRIDILNTEINQKTSVLEKFSVEKKELSEAITLKNQEILKLREEDRFSSETPLPKGFRFAAPIDYYETLKDAYKKPPTTITKRYISYDIDDTLFSSVTYYHLNCKNKDRISHILFQYRSVYDSYREDRDKSNHLKKPPSVSESTELKKNTITAMLQTFREKYGPEFAIDEDKHYFDIKSTWTASISDIGLIIYTALSDEDLKSLCGETT